MRKIAWSAIGFLLILAGILVCFYKSPGKPVSDITPKAPVSTPVQPAKEKAVEQPQEISSPVSPPPKKVSEQPAREAIAPLTVDKGKSTFENRDETSYVEYQYSQQKHENSGFELTPGVTVKSGTIHIKQDESNDKSVEIERNPKDSSNEYQIMWKKKF